MYQELFRKLLRVWKQPSEIGTIFVLILQMRSTVICPMSLRQNAVEPGLKPSQFGSKACTMKISASIAESITHIQGQVVPSKWERKTDGKYKGSSTLWIPTGTKYSLVNEKGTSRKPLEFSTQLTNIYWISLTIPVTGDTAVNKPDKNL